MSRWDLITIPITSRKRVVSSQNAELKALEERLRATEQRLREKQSYSSSTYTRVGSEKLPGNLAHRNRQPISFSSVQLNSSTKHPAPSQPQSLGETNPTHRTGFMPGALPESPWSTTGSDYILVEGDSSAEWEDKT